MNAADFPTPAEVGALLMQKGGEEMDGNTQRSDITIEVTVETTGLTPEEHDQRVRWVYRNMLNTNSDLRDAFYVAAVRDLNGELLGFLGAGRGKPSTEIKQVLESYMDEGPPS